MKRNLVVVLLAAVFTAPLAQAEGPYAGVSYTLVEYDDIETDNLGLVIGYLWESGLGFDFDYAKTVSEDSVSANGVSADASLDTWGLYATYQTAGDLYFKGRLGYAVVQLDLEGAGDTDENASGFAYGVAAGMVFGDGAFEASYSVLPDEDFQGADVDADAELFAIRYQWNL